MLRLSTRGYRSIVLFNREALYAWRFVPVNLRKQGSAPYPYSIRAKPETEIDGILFATEKSMFIPDFNTPGKRPTADQGANGYRISR